MTLGFIWHEICLIAIEGVKEYLQSWKNILNSTMNVIYLCSFFLKYYTLAEVHLAKQQVSSAAFWAQLAQPNASAAHERQLFAALYWLNADRYFWIEMDPINISEGLFAIANLLSFLRIGFYLPANQQLGPLQISLGNMLAVRRVTLLAYSTTSRSLSTFLRLFEKLSESFRTSRNLPEASEIFHGQSEFL